MFNLFAKTRKDATMNKNVLSIEKLESRTLLSVVPNDPLLSSQWALNSTSLYGAWSQNTGSKNVVVAIIDSGIDLTHPDLKNNVWTNPFEIAGDGIDNENNGYVDDIYGWNFANNNNNVQDGYGHGTHVAGIVGAEGNNSLGVAGVNWNVSIMPLKFMDDQGVGNTGGAAQAMMYASMMKKNYGVNVVVANASWGGTTGFSDTLYNAINQLNDAGIVLTTAAGNYGSDTDITPRYPGCFNVDNVINVGALTSDGVNLATFSNYGATSVDLAAPGSMIYSTMRSNYYGYKSGTSMASPFVAGTVALLNSIKPNLSVAEVKSAIFGNVDKLSSLFGKVATGGKLNIEAAVDSLLNIPYQHNQAVVGGITSQTLTTVAGWAKDPDSPNTSINMQLWIDNVLIESKLSNVDGSFVFNLGGLRIGSHSINIKAQDTSNGSWASVGSTTVDIPPPVIVVNKLNTRRLSGWVTSDRSGSAPVTVRVLINDRWVAGQVASKYRSDLVGSSGGPHHGFDMVLNPRWFRKGYNVVKIQVFDPISQQVSLVAMYRVRK